MVAHGGVQAVIGDTIDATVDTGVAAAEGDWGGVVTGAATLGCDVGKLCNGIGKVVGVIPGSAWAVDRAGKWVRGGFRSKTQRPGSGTKESDGGARSRRGDKTFPVGF